MKHLRPTTVEDHPDGSFTITTHQDVQGIVDLNKELLNSYGSMQNHGNQVHGMRVANIPFTVLEQWAKETNGAVNDPDGKVLMKYLNDPDNKYFRTTPTRV